MTTTTEAIAGQRVMSPTGNAVHVLSHTTDGDHGRRYVMLCGSNARAVKVQEDADLTCARCRTRARAGDAPASAPVPAPVNRVAPRYRTVVRALEGEGYVDFSRSRNQDATGHGFVVYNGSGGSVSVQSTRSQNDPLRQLEFQAWIDAIRDAGMNGQGVVGRSGRISAIRVINW